MILQLKIVSVLTPWLFVEFNNFWVYKIKYVTTGCLKKAWFHERFCAKHFAQNEIVHAQ
jgi:hypothetical protein